MTVHSSFLSASISGATSPHHPMASCARETWTPDSVLFTPATLCLCAKQISLSMHRGRVEWRVDCFSLMYSPNGKWIKPGDLLFTSCCLTTHHSLWRLLPRGRAGSPWSTGRSRWCSRISRYHTPSFQTPCTHSGLWKHGETDTDACKQLTDRGTTQPHVQLHTNTYVCTPAHAFHCSSCFQCNGCTARGRQEACGVAVLSKCSRQQEWPRTILSQQPKNLWRELRGDVPGGETPPAYNGVIHTFLWGKGAPAPTT